MRKRLLFLLLPLLLAGCGDNPSPTPAQHEHTFLNEWTTSATSHWHAATCEHTDLTKDLSEHVDANKDGKCDTCDYSIPTPTPAPHEHTFSSDWEVSVTSHWHSATCEHTNLTKDLAEHIDTNKDGKCDVCNYLLPTPTPEPHEHTFSSAWSSDETSHWHIATCEHTNLTKDFGSHIDGDGNNICDICNSEIPGPGPEPHEHTFSDNYSNDESSHWQAATCEHTEFTRNFGAHVDENVDYKCDVCGYNLPIPGPVPTKYKVTIGEADHFEAVETEVEFSKDDFTKIVISYNMESNYCVDTLTVDPVGACTFKIYDNEITICPQSNANFTVTPVTRRIYQFVDVDCSERISVKEPSSSFLYNDFSTIEFDYATEDYYVLSNVQVSPAEAAVATYDDNKVYVTPKENADLTITPVISRVDYVNLISIEGDEHFIPVRDELYFGYYDFNYFDVDFSLVDGYAIDQINVSSNENVTCELRGKYLRITPLKNADATISITTTIANSKTINFHTSFEDSVLGKDAEESITIQVGHTFGEGFDVDKQIAISPEKQYDFIGWSFSDDGINVSTIPLETIITEETPADVYAVFRHFVGINYSCKSLKVDDVTYDSATSAVLIWLSVTDFDIYEMPLAKEDFVIDAGGPPTYLQYNRDEAGDIGTILIPLSFMGDTGLIIIGTVDYRPQFLKSYEGDSHLSLDLSENLYKGTDYTFSVQAVNGYGEDYCIPYTFDISINGGEPLSENAYSIDVFNSARQEAFVTIKGQYVKGDMTIDATPSHIDFYYYNFIGLGVELEGGISSRGYVNPETDSLSLILRNAETISEDNVYIHLNNESWYKINELPSEYQNLFVFYDNFKTINIKTIDDSALRKSILKIEVVVYESDYNVFENNSWADIDNLARSPYVSDFFEIGQTKTVTANAGIPYTVRIVGISHDRLTADKTKKAGLTIEFVELLTNDNWTLHKGEYDKANSGRGHQVYDGTMSDYLNNFFKKINVDLSTVIKEVNKDYYYTTSVKGGKMTYNCKLFPFSLTEVGLRDSSAWSGEGTTYEYYALYGKEARKKHAVQKPGENVPGPSEYYLRSKNTDDDDGKLVFYISGTGNSHDNGDFFDSRSYMAAFCV